MSEEMHMNSNILDFDGEEPNISHFVHNNITLLQNGSSPSFDFGVEFRKLLSLQIVLPIFLIGVFGNLTTICVIIYRKWYAKVTYLTILLLAVADLKGVIIRFTFSRISISISDQLINFITHWIIRSSLIASNLHVVILFRLRYFLIVQPIESLSITPVNILKQSGTALIGSLIFGAIFQVALEAQSNSTNELIAYSIGAMLVFISMFLPVFWYHYRKVKSLRKNHTLRISVVKRMNLLMTGVVTIQIIVGLLVPISELFIFSFKGSHSQVAISVVAYVLEMLNHAVNPVIYFLAISFGSIINLLRTFHPV